MSFAGEALGHFIANSRWEDMPATLRHAGRRSILNAIGCGLGVARDPAVTTALAVMRPFSGAAEATVLGQAIVRVLNDPQTASARARLAQAYVEDSLAWPVIAGMTCDLYQAVLGARQT